MARHFAPGWAAFGQIFYRCFIHLLPIFVWQEVNFCFWILWVEALTFLVGVKYLVPRRPHLVARVPQHLADVDGSHQSVATIHVGSLFILQNFGVEFCGVSTALQPIVHRVLFSLDLIHERVIVGLPVVAFQCPLITTTTPLDAHCRAQTSRW